jgi:methyl-accepting chemotaxis protein
MLRRLTPISEFTTEAVFNRNGVLHPELAPMPVRNLTIKSKLFAIITVLGLLPCVATAVSFYLLKVSNEAQIALDKASLGTIHLEHINGLVYAVVMESRGIYMSADAGQAEPFARNMSRQLAELQERAKAWRTTAIESERTRIATLSASIDEFVRFRTELIRLAREVSTAAARTFGDNDANRTVRSGLNKQLDELARAYEQHTERAYRQIAANEQISLALQFGLAVIAGAAVLIGLMLVRGALIQPLVKLKAVMQRIARNDLAGAIPGLARHDEIGDMARTIEVFRDNAIERQKLQAASEAMREEEAQRSNQLEALVQEIKATRAQEAERNSGLEQLIRKFRGIITNVTNALGNETAAMRGAAGALGNVASTAADRANEAASASDGAATNAQTVAAATEQLSSSIKEISAQAHRASAIVSEAASSASASDRDVQSLADAVSRIGAVTEIINTIAAQTNLLALNATIEAARAGEAGRGFAVVASEVKQLAGQTAKATQEIADQVSGIQASTTTAVHSIRAIATKVGEIQHLNTAIAAAIEKQEAAAKDIAHNVALAAEGSRHAVASVAAVTSVASKTNREADRVLGASETLAGVTSELSQSVEMFLAAVTSDLAERRRAERRETNQNIHVTAAGQTHRPQMLDFSENGARIAPNPGLQKGSAVTVDVGDGSTGATVAWANPAEAGLSFDEGLAGVPAIPAVSAGRTPAAA